MQEIFIGREKEPSRKTIYGISDFMFRFWSVMRLVTEPL